MSRTTTLCYWLAAVLLAACSGGESAPNRDAGASGSGGTSSSNTGGSGGTSHDASTDVGADGDAAQPLPDSGDNLALPAGCAPDDMRFACNPVTNDGCDTAAGEACEYGDADEFFTCFPAPNDVEEGGACHAVDGPWCAPTLNCDFQDPENPSGVCRRHCCVDSDCESPQTCDTFDPEFGSLGVCR